MWPFKTKVIENKKPPEEVDVNIIVEEWKERPKTSVLLCTVHNYVTMWNGNFFKGMSEPNKEWVFYRLIDYINMVKGE